MRKMTEDKSIINAMRNDMPMGFRLLMKKYEQPLYWHIRRMVVTYDDAQDVMQETLVRAFRFFSQYDEGKSLKSWLYHIATNESLRHLGRLQGKSMMSLDDVSPIDVAMTDGNAYYDSSDEIAAKLQRAIQSLPAKQQLAFNLRYYDELSYDEIAEITGVSATSMKANYHVAKEKITYYMNHND